MSPNNAPLYEQLLTSELFPHFKQSIGDRGYLGHEMLRERKGDEVRITTLVWFTSLEAVRSFAGVDFSKAVLTDKAKSLVSRWMKKPLTMKWSPRQVASAKQHRSASGEEQMSDRQLSALGQ